MKVSIIMQSYLGEYPGSRSDADKKFLRAVNSFKNQINKNAELVIVSDGCQITHDLYHANFKKESNIKYVYVSKTKPNMYSIENGMKYHRGFPRQVGRSLATGEVTTYMDSDDFLMPNFTDVWLKWWIPNYEKIDCIFNQSWWDNIAEKEDPTYKDLDYDSFEIKEIDGLPSKWIHVSFKGNFRMQSPPLTSHRSDLDVKWQDTIGYSEDWKFSEGLRVHRKGMISEPTYVICHSKNKWDY